jgi:hypothetical protein
LLSVFIYWSSMRRSLGWIIFGLWTVSTSGGFFGRKVELVTKTTKFLSGTFHFSL